MKTNIKSNQDAITAWTVEVNGKIDPSVCTTREAARYIRRIKSKSGTVSAHVRKWLFKLYREHVDMSDKTEVVLLGLAVVFLLVLLGLGPILTIMSLNALFNLGIAYNIYTWLSVAWLNFTTFGGLAMAINRLKNK